MSATVAIPVNMAQQTRPVRLNPTTAEKVRLIAQWMTDTDYFRDKEVTSMGDLLEKWAEPHIKQFIQLAVRHAEKKNKELLD